ncbi:hypothetical protein [Defluviicoccus vanus]|uniref:Uncharacterized protein n=1 Tax=Defluviicoccus vanus TaxID=111831 RepID=A0A7H1MZ42_9PROT|nr:hypothetical protein [Defluviicoccus vanus]QNT68728.1 hypothetical protein HQ394_04285 [Defluviicoccus vanus]
MTENAAQVGNTVVEGVAHETITKVVGEIADSAAVTAVEKALHWLIEKVIYGFISLIIFVALYVVHHVWDYIMSLFG